MWNADSFNSIHKRHSQLGPKDVHNNHSLLLCISKCLLCGCMASVETLPPNDIWKPVTSNSHPVSLGTHLCQLWEGGRT